MLHSTPAVKAFTANPSFLLRLDLDLSKDFAPRSVLDFSFQLYHQIKTLTVMCVCFFFHLIGFTSSFVRKGLILGQDKCGVSQPVGRDPMWSQMELKLGLVKYLVFDF